MLNENAFAAPNWQKYIAASVESPDVGECGAGKLICADKAWHEQYFESQCFYNLEVALHSVERDYIAPWDATYWKQLEGAHRIRFREPDESEEENFEPTPWHHIAYTLFANTYTLFIDGEPVLTHEATVFPGYFGDRVLLFVSSPRKHA